MKKMILIMIMIFTYLQASSNYILKINNKTYNISNNKPISIYINGKKANINLFLNKIQHFKDKYIKFNYYKDLVPTSSKISFGINQIVAKTALGNNIVIQEYPMALRKEKLFKRMKATLKKMQPSYTIQTKNEKIIKILKDKTILEGIKYKNINSKNNKIISSIEMYFKNKNNKSVFIFILKQDFKNDLFKIKDKKKDRMFNMFWKSLIIK